MVDRTRKNSE